MPTLEQIQAKLKKLQAQADLIIARKAQVAVNQIRDLMLKHGLTTEDIEAKAKAKRTARGLNGHAGNGKAKTIGAAKAAKYRDHKTGATWSGRGPAPAWLATVKDRTKFLIDSAAAAASGAGHQAAKTATKAAAKAGKAKSAATSGAVSKKAAARKVVAKKAAASKKTAAKKATAATRKVAAKKPAAKKTAATKAARKAPARKSAAKTVATSAAAAPQTPTVQASA
jgi:DNA-binding protein H-NS